MKSATQVNGRKKKGIVAETIEYQGICPSCENLPICSFIHSSRKPVTFCEEFAINGTPKMANTSKKQEAVTVGRAPLGRYNGLCTTCENYNSCVFPKDEAGIWRCEEYR
jgi:hypothetical protein